jgi:hypothetical protein
MTKVVRNSEVMRKLTKIGIGATETTRVGTTKKVPLDGQQSVRNA